jgi:hypothetical protein
MSEASLEGKIDAAGEGSGSGEGPGGLLEHPFVWQHRRQARGIKRDVVEADVGPRARLVVDQSEEGMSTPPLPRQAQVEGEGGIVQRVRERLDGAERVSEGEDAMVRESVRGVAREGEGATRVTHLRWDGMGWDGMGWDRMRWDRTSVTHEEPRVGRLLDDARLESEGDVAVVGAREVELHRDQPAM